MQLLLSLRIRCARVPSKKLSVERGACEYVLIHLRMELLIFSTIRGARVPSKKLSVGQWASADVSNVFISEICCSGVILSGESARLSFDYLQSVEQRSFTVLSRDDPIASAF